SSAAIASSPMARFDSGAPPPGDAPRTPEFASRGSEGAARWSGRAGAPLGASTGSEATSTWDALRTTDFASRESEEEDRWSGRAADQLGESSGSVATSK